MKRGEGSESKGGGRSRLDRFNAPKSNEFKCNNSHHPISTTSTSADSYESGNTNAEVR